MDVRGSFSHADTTSKGLVSVYACATSTIHVVSESLWFLPGGLSIVKEKSGLYIMHTTVVIPNYGFMTNGGNVLMQ